MMDFDKKYELIDANLNRKRKVADEEDLIKEKKAKCKEISVETETKFGVFIGETTVISNENEDSFNENSFEEKKDEVNIQVPQMVRNTNGNCLGIVNEPDSMEFSSEVKPTSSNNSPFAKAMHKSPKKRLKMPDSSNKNEIKRNIFVYGNYKQYYGYRNKCDLDNRLEIFSKYSELFTNKKILDIGCNTGFITKEVAKRFQIQHITGLDIDSGLINAAIKMVSKSKKRLPYDNDLKRLNKYPYNITFKHGNYVLRDDCLLEIEKPQFDLILCLSVTKWVHLNFGDKGLKQAFKRIFLQLNPGGKLVLESQPFSSYRKRKRLTEEIFRNYEAMKLLPNEFEAFLLSSEIGFINVTNIVAPDDNNKGFKRPIQIFTKQ